MVRQADIKDVSRIAEILIFTKRMAYRPIFHDDKVSFGQMQVVPLAAQYMERPEKLLHMWVYDDLFVKGLITLQLIQSVEGGRVLQVDGMGLWVLEKNSRARLFYEKDGFVLSEKRKLEEGTPEYTVWYQKKLA